MGPEEDGEEVGRLKARIAELEHLLAAREQALLTQSDQSESATKGVSDQVEALRAMVVDTASTTGRDFFRTLVSHLAATLKVRYALVGELQEGEEDRIQTLAVWAGNGFTENVSYDLRGTPCANVVGQRLCFYQSGVQRLFPEDRLLADMGVDSYCGTPLFDRAGKALGILVVLHDQPMQSPPDVKQVLTVFAARAAGELERKRAEEALQKTTRDLQTLIQASPLAFIALDGRGNVTSWNAAAQRIFGWSEQEVLGRPLPYVPEGEQSESDALWESVMEGQFLKGVELRRHRKDGSIVDLSFWAAPLLDTSGNVISTIGLLADVTERKRLEEQLRQAAKMEAVGRLAGGVAHDFNNLLTVMRGYGELLLQRLEQGDPRRKYAEAIKKAGDRAAALTHQLLAFSRKQVLQPATLDLNAVVANLSEMVQRLIGEHIELVAVLDPALRLVKADAGQIEQALMNLVVNARDAMPQGGRLMIETANAELDEAFGRQHGGIPTGSYVRLAISDTGSGMDAQTKAHIFEPFFTTKEMGKGTGLGLAMVYGIVTQTGGFIEVASESGRGTTVTIYLPQAATGGVEPATAPPVRTHGAGETILLVEDEPTVRGFAREILKINGYQVLEAAKGEEALRLCGQCEVPIHLLLTDVVMPGMSGRQLADRARAVRSDMKVLFMSGYTDDEVLRHGVSSAGTGFLQKPFAPDVLARKVREVLDSPLNGILDKDV